MNAIFYEFNSLLLSTIAPTSDPPPVVDRCTLEPRSLDHRPLAVIWIVVARHGWAVIGIRLIAPGDVQAVTIIDFSHDIVIPHHHNVIVSSTRLGWGWWWRRPITGFHVGDGRIGTRVTVIIWLIEPHGCCSGLVAGNWRWLNIPCIINSLKIQFFVPESITISVLILSIAEVVHSTSMVILGPIEVRNLQGLSEEIADQGYVYNPQKESSESHPHHDTSGSLGGHKNCATRLNGLSCQSNIEGFRLGRNN